MVTSSVARSCTARPRESDMMGRAVECVAGGGKTHGEAVVVDVQWSVGGREAVPSAD